MLDGNRLRDHRANTATTDKSRERHQQVAEQCEQQPHHPNRTLTVTRPSAICTPRPVPPKSAIRHIQGLKEAVAVLSPAV